MSLKDLVNRQEPEVICFGEALIDRLGPPGGDPEVDRPLEDCFGGAPANVACGLARLGISVAFFIKVLRDAFNPGAITQPL